MPAHDVILTEVETITKDPKLATRIANAVHTALDTGGWLTTENDHLAMMRVALKRIADAVSDPDCTARDLAALTNRLQQFSAEVTTMEEKQRQEGRIHRGSTRNGAAKAKGGFDNSKV